MTNYFFSSSLSPTRNTKCPSNMGSRERVWTLPDKKPPTTLPNSKQQYHVMLNRKNGSHLQFKVSQRQSGIFCWIHWTENSCEAKTAKWLQYERTPCSISFYSEVCCCFKIERIAMSTFQEEELPMSTQARIHPETKEHTYAPRILKGSYTNIF